MWVEFRRFVAFECGDDLVDLLCGKAGNLCLTGDCRPNYWCGENFAVETDGDWFAGVCGCVLINGIWSARAHEMKGKGGLSVGKSRAGGGE